MIEGWALDSLRALVVDPHLRLAAWNRSRKPWDTPDELAQTFDESFSVLRHRGPGSTDPRNEIRFRLLQSVDEALGDLNAEGAEIWSDEAFRDHPRWARVRKLAEEAIAQWGAN